MNFTKDQLEDYISNLIFSVNKLNAFDVAEKYGLDIEERDRMYNAYRPITIVNSLTLQELKEYLLLRKQKFIDSNGFFDFEIFMDNENLGVNILKSELNELIGLTPLLWHSVDGTNRLLQEFKNNNNELYLNTKLVYTLGTVTMATLLVLAIVLARD